MTPLERGESTEEIMDVDSRGEFADRMTIWNCDTLIEHDHAERGCKGATYLREGLFHEEQREGDDGRGSYPPQPGDRPSTRYRRLVGPWEKA